jgi:hypothetical protein
MSKDYGGADVPEADSNRRHSLENLITITQAMTIREAAFNAKLLALAEREEWHWCSGQETELARRLAAELGWLADKG